MLLLTIRAAGLRIEVRVVPDPEFNPPRRIIETTGESVPPTLPPAAVVVPLRRAA